MQRNQSSPRWTDAAAGEREPDGEDRLGQARPVRDDDADDVDVEVAVAHRPNPLPLREEDEEELSEADILDELDMDDVDAAEPKKLEGPDA